MQIGKLFPKTPSLSPDQLRGFMDAHPLGSYTLLDVRQPQEYERRHLPGAELIPLPELSARLAGLDPGKPLVAYCAVGGRSQAAAQLLQGQGFGEVYSLAGGTKAWDGLAAIGPEDWGLDIAEPGQGPAAVLAAAYGLEQGLALFYQALAGRRAGRELTALFDKLAAIEESHQQRLRQVHQALPLAERQQAPLEQSQPARMEGGYTLPEFLEQQGNALDSQGQALMLAMGIETQALDLYLRLAQRAQHEQSRRALLGISAEEQAHLKEL